MSARIANAIAEAYLADQVDNKNEANRRATEWLEERLAELRRNLQVAEEAVATYRRDKGLAGSPEGVVSTQTLSDLNSRYIGAKTRRIEKESRLVALSKASLNPNEVANIAEVASNTTLARCASRRSTSTRKIAEISDDLRADNHPKIVQAAGRAGLGARPLPRARPRASRSPSVPSSTPPSRRRRSSSAPGRARPSVMVGATSQYEAELKQLEREAQSNRALYESFLNRFKELREQQDIQRADARILAYAWPSGAPSSPQVQDRPVRRLPDRLPARHGGRGRRREARPGVPLGLPGREGHRRRRARHGAAGQGLGRRCAPTSSRTVLDRTTSSAAEAMRAVFTAISLSNLDRPARVIAVTSSTPSRGQDHLRRRAGRPAHQDERLAPRAAGRPRPAPGQAGGRRSASRTAAAPSTST